MRARPQPTDSRSTTSRFRTAARFRLPPRFRLPHRFPFRFRFRSRLAIAAVLLITPVVLHAQVDPTAEYRTLHTTHFRVSYQPELETMAHHAATRAEAVHAVLSAALVQPPRGTIDIVIADDFDVSNGAATPLPSNRIWIYAKPPVDVRSLAYNRDWIDLVVTHELTHIFHLDAHGRLGSAFRTVFGRLPFTWPVFPALGTPLWSLEGVAVQVESARTGLGRIHGSWHETVVRSAVLAGEPDLIDRVSGSTPIWPGNERVYIYGSLFLDWVSRTYGDSLPGQLVQRVAGSWLPPGLFFDRIPRSASGHTFTELYDEWLVHLRSRYAALADSLAAIGLTDAAPLTEHGYHARHPRISPDGKRVAYAAADGRNVARTRILDATTGRELAAARRTSLAAIAWTPSGDLVTSQLEWNDRYRYLADLYRVDQQGREHRVTRGARLQDPDVAYDGRRIVAIRNDAGSTDVVLLGFDGERITTQRTITDGNAQVHWALPRFGPDGRIAVSRSTGDIYQIVLLDTLGTTLRTITHDAALDMGATFSADGRWLVFSSDRSGIPNLYAADLHDADAPLRQVTNVLGAAYEPDLARDGTSIVYSAYDADGFHVVRMPFRPETWRVAPPPAAIATAGAARRAAPESGTIYDPGAVTADTTARRSGSYSAWRTARPWFWLPLAYTQQDVGTFLGASSFGQDVIGRHTWSASAAVAPDDGRTSGEIGYAYAGWGNPLLTIGAGRDWDRIGYVRLPDTTQIRPVTEREDVLSARLGFARPRARLSLGASVGAELVRRRRIIEDGVGARLVDAADDLVGMVGSVALGTARTQPLSISREDGVALAITGRQRWDRSPDAIDGGYREVTTSNAAYRSLDLPGFARHVLALRASGLLRTGPGATPSSIGGAAGLQIDAPVELDLGPGSLLLPVRGFPRGVRAGTRAWSASAEYRFPLAAVGRGIRILPLFLDRISAAAFADAGDAWCASDVADRFLRCLRTAPGTPLLAAGAELHLDLGLLGYGSLRTRLGAAFPIRGPDTGTAFYLRFGQAF